MTQEIIDKTRQTLEDGMLSDLKKLESESGDLDRRGDNGETAVCSTITISQSVIGRLDFSIVVYN